MRIPKIFSEPVLKPNRNMGFYVQHMDTCTRNGCITTFKDAHVCEIVFVGSQIVTHSLGIT